jgi:integrase
MAHRIRFTKAAIAALPTPDQGARATYYDSEIQKLAIRLTAAGCRTFYVVRRDGAQMVWLKLGTFPDMTPEAARNAAQRALGDFARGVNPAALKREERKKLTLGEAFDHYCEQHAIPRKVKSANWLRELWERCLGPLPDLPPKRHGRKRTKHPAGVEWSKRKLDAITSAEVRGLHTSIGKKHPTMANRVVELLSTIYNRASEWGYGGVNPANGIEPFKETKRDRFIKPDELPRFFKELTADTSLDFQHFVLLGLLTGARRTHILGMRWQDTDIESATWRIPDTKNDDPQIVALVPEATEILRARSPKATGFVFPADSKTGHITAPKQRWRELLKRAEVSDLRVHDLRRSLGSWQAISGASLVVIGKSLGHKSPSATAIYARLHLDPVRASVNTATTAMLRAAGVKKTGKVVKLRR